jgi:hypothetical protein
VEAQTIADDAFHEVHRHFMLGGELRNGFLPVPGYCGGDTPDDE